MSAPHPPQTARAVDAAIEARVPVAQIARQHGVSRTYVQGRAVRLGLPYPKSPGPDHPWRHTNPPPSASADAH